MQGGYECGRFRNVAFKLSGKLSKLRLLLLHFELSLLIFGFCRLEIGYGALVGILKLTVALHNIADVVDKTEKFADGVGAEKHLYVAVSAVLLHAADTLLELYKLFVRKLLGFIDLFCLLSNEILMQCDLLLKHLYLLQGDGVFLIECGFKLNKLVLLTLQRIYRRLNIFLLFLETALLLLEIVDLGLSNGVCLYRDERYKKRQSKDQCEEQ